MPNLKKEKGNRGGHAIATDNGSTAIGGDAGFPSNMPGGRGGDARATLPQSTIVGGRGGRGGISEGMPGMDVSDEGQTIGGANLYIEGGMGGEASQLDGRGGRGGQAPSSHIIDQLLGRSARAHMKRPYWPDDRIEYGRGGDAPDTPQYRARRLIVEMIKAECVGARQYFTTEVWYERDAVSMDVINNGLALLGMSWRAALDDHEYVFGEVTS